MAKEKNTPPGKASLSNNINVISQIKTDNRMKISILLIVWFLTGLQERIMSLLSMLIIRSSKLVLKFFISTR
jgi:hypothetical protein